MTHAPAPFMLRATTAICAVIALGTTPAWAQDAAAALEAPAAPTLQLPVDAPAAPAANAPAAVSQPVVQQAPPVAEQPATESPAAAKPASMRAPAARPAARAEAARSEPAPQPVAAAAPMPVTLVPVAPTSVTPPVPESLAPPVTDPAADAPREVPDNDAMLGAGAIAALLLAFGIGGGAWFAARARRRRRWDGEQGAYEAPPAQVVEPAPVAVPLAANDPTASEPPLPAFATVEDVLGEPEPARPSLAPSLATPDGPVPQTREERDALLDRMASALPSAENPFTSRKARLRRARLILQAREHAEKQNAAQPFDWRTYKPSARQPDPATPPRVTA